MIKLNKTPFTLVARRGLKANLPALLAYEGELAYTKDEPALYTGDENFIPLPVVGQVPRVRVDDDYAADLRDYLIAVTVVSKTVTLPTGAGLYNGKTYIVEDASGAADVSTPITIDTAGTETINGGSSITIESAYGGVQLDYDGVDEVWIARSFGSSAIGGGGGSVEPAFTPMDDGDFAWVNQGGASVNVVDDTVYLLAPFGSGENLRIRKKAVPTAPYTVTMALRPMLYPANYSACGMLLRESGSGKLVTLGMMYVATYNGFSIEIYKYTNPTIYSSYYITGFSLSTFVSAFIWLRIVDDGTNRVLYISADGRNFFQLHTVGNTDFITPDEIGIFSESNNGSTGDAGMTVYSWEES